MHRHSAPETTAEEIPLAEAFFCSCARGLTVFVIGHVKINNYVIPLENITTVLMRKLYKVLLGHMVIRKEWVLAISPNNSHFWSPKQGHSCLLLSHNYSLPINSMNEHFTELYVWLSSGRVGPLQRDLCFHKESLNPIFHAAGLQAL